MKEYVDLQKKNTVETLAISAILLKEDITLWDTSVGACHS